jgi:D-alanyl-D-alanine carboxypeptidase/D-alanyl-D-alanine-endopeptidase (penicillin-binding protein 4)
MALNIEIADSVASAAPYNKMKPVADWFSPPVSTLVNLTNQHSINLYAEHLMKLLALQKLHNGSPEAGCKAVLDFWKEKNIDTRGLFIYDGCGISRYNGVTAKQLASVLLYMTRSDNFVTFYNSLPLAGETGTLANMFQGTRAQGNLRAKSGTMSRVKSYCGYLRTVSGKRIIFAFIVNNFTCTQEEIKEKLEKAMVSLTGL